MQCKDILWQIPEGLLAEPARSEELRLHLASCPACRERMAALEDAVLLLRLEPREAPAPGFAERVMLKLALERAGAAVQAPSRRTALIGLAIVAAAIVALGLVWASSELVMTLRPGGALLAGLAGLIAGLVNVLVAAGAVVRALVTAARAIPLDVLQAIDYSVQLCCVIVFLGLIWLAGRSRRPSRGGNSLA